jgi:hypothetical protein
MKRKYCSVKCHHERDFKLRCRLLERGLYPASLQSPFLKKYLIAKFGERCARCGWQERHPKTGRVPIEVEHVDGDWRNNSQATLSYFAQTVIRSRSLIERLIAAMAALRVLAGVKTRFVEFTQ